MKISIVYVYAGSVGQQYQNYTSRFLESYNANPPGLEHETVVVCNGSMPNSELSCLFSCLPNCRFLYHDNSGYDIGAFQIACKRTPCDMIVFFGSSTFFFRCGWLLRMAEAFVQNGNAQYGTMGNRGDLTVKVWPHIRTTAFWMNPELMNAYPNTICMPDQRHPFEHGKNCFTSWVNKRGLKSWVVTWNNIFTWENWDNDQNGFHRGNQSSLLAGDHLCERPYYPSGQCLQNSLEPCSPWKSEICWSCLADGR